MSELERIFKGLADGNRLRILNLLLHGELCVCEIQHVLESPQPNVSRHLTYLKNSGLVLDRREGFRVYYRLSEVCQGEARLLFDFLRQICRRDDALRADVEKLKHAIRHGDCTVSAFRPYSALRGEKTTPHADR
ncbi:MAG TPA: metalloregulator ArsR/SmtB family transcription factor [Terriglobales bacterium]|nr:metalloregulator ArsR/SmtB family transcription factor [Terriglobales bacterium]